MYLIFKINKLTSGILVAVADKNENQNVIDEHLDELGFLAHTLNIKTTKKFFQRLDAVHSKFFVGSGKLQEIKSYILENNTHVVIFDDELTPSQLRNIEKELKIKIYDRSLLILDIFLKRAQTAQSKTQVELARFQYLLPRLTRMWSHLERQRGGTGTRGGAGEKEIETDRRIIRKQIAVLKQKLHKIEKQGITRRKSRDGIVRVALVGYTNAGKSTLMRLLSKSEVKVKNELFATLDATVRKVVIQNVPFLLSDTVGFIRKLPHNLIESFKSTLAEVHEAHILLHVVDYANPNHHSHIDVVNSTLSEMGASNNTLITVYNKVDAVPSIDPFSLENSNELEVYISAKNKKNIESLKKILCTEISKYHFTMYPNYLKNQIF